MVPVPVDLIDKGLVEAGFKVEAENEGYDTFKAEDIGDGLGEDDFLRIWLWRPKKDQADGVTNSSPEANSHEKSLVLRIGQNARFNLQFPRKVMAQLLGLEERAHWQDCAQDDAEETGEAEAFKKAFEAFDFTLTEA